MVSIACVPLVCMVISSGSFERDFIFVRRSEVKRLFNPTSSKSSIEPKHAMQQNVLHMRSHFLPLLQRYQRELSVAAALGILLLVLAVAAPRFYQGDKLRSILVASAPVLVAAVGMTLVILSRNIDISI